MSQIPLPRSPSSIPRPFLRAEWPLLLLLLFLFSAGWATIEDWKMSRILLLLLFLISYSSSQQYKIEWDRCTKDMKCFIRESCIEGKTDDKKLVAYTHKPLKEGCDATIQIKSYTEKKWLVMIQVNASENAAGISDDGISFKQTTVQFKCDKNGVTGNSVLGHDKLDIRSDGKILFCAFTIKAAETIKSIFADNEEFAAMEFTTDSPQTLTYGDSFWADAMSEKNCDPDKFSSPDVSDSTYMLHKLDPNGVPPFTCESSQFLRIHVAGSPDPLILDKGVEIVCSANHWKYKMPTKLSKIPNEFTAHCAEKYCSVCKPLVDLTCPGCTPSVQNTDAEYCKSAVCTDKEWMLEGGKLFTGEMECKKDSADSTSKSSVWYPKTESTPVTKAACIKKDICWSSANLKDLNATGQCLSDTDCLPLTKSADFTELSCPEALPLSYMTPAGAVETTKLSCDFFSGKYKDDKSQELAEGSSVFCGRKKKEEPATVASASALSGSIPYIAGGGGALLLIVVVAIVVVFVVRKKKSETKKKTPQRTLGLYSAEAPSQQGGDSNKSVIPQSVVVSAGEPPPPPTNSELPRLPTGPKGPFLQRERDKQPRLKCDHNLWKNFNENKYQTKMLPRINQYDQEPQRYIFLAATSLQAYCDKREDKMPYGYLRHFFELMSYSAATHNDCYATWDRIFRRIRLLDAVVMRKAPKDAMCVKLKLCERLRNILVTCARPIFNELGWTMAPNEDPKDTLMRFWAVRVMLWADQPEVHTELTRLSALPFEELESPMRAVVLAYQTRNQNRGEEIKDKHWLTVIADPRDAEKDKFGTTRQHLLFGLMAARDEKKAGTPGEFQVLRDVCSAIFDVDTMYGTSDHLWAYLGGTEYWSNTKPLIDQMMKTASLFDGKQWMDGQLTKLTQGKDAKEAEQILHQHAQPFIDSWDVIGESCWTRKQYKEWSDAVCYIEEPIIDALHIGHDQLIYEERGSNLDMFCAEKKFAVLFDDGLKRFEQQ